jgi:hypothetical protein
MDDAHEKLSGVLADEMPLRDHAPFLAAIVILRYSEGSSWVG